MIERLCIVGVGLIGGSLAKDLKRKRLTGEIDWGYTARPQLP